MTQRQRRWLLASSKGGTGKTTTASLLAWEGAKVARSVFLADVDPQEAGSACQLFDLAAEHAPGNISWAKLTPEALLQALNVGAIEQELVVIDSPPRFDDAHLQAVARVVDGVIIPGAVGEYPTVVQTAKTLRLAAPETPLWVAITKAGKDLRSALGVQVLQEYEAMGLRLWGVTRENTGLAHAMVFGELPDQLPARERRRLSSDVADWKELHATR